MKNLYPKGKGKIHPSPASPSAAAGSGSPANGDALAVLKLLPAAILALTAALGFEDKEVLAYLMMRSINGPVAEATEERRRCRRIAGVHQPLFDCGCFDCYTSFWSRWDCSPDRELIHQAIEAFEEHLATSERKGTGSGGKGRRRERRAGGDRSEKGKKSKEKERKKADAAAEEDKGFEEDAVSANESFSVEDKVEVERREEENEEVSGSEVEIVTVGGERRRGWPDVMGLVNSRLWNLWSPGM